MVETPCWYCLRRPALVLCDHRIGSSLGQPVQVQPSLRASL